MEIQIEECDNGVMLHVKYPDGETEKLVCEFEDNCQGISRSDSVKKFIGNFIVREITEVLDENLVNEAILKLDIRPLKPAAKA